VGGVPTPHPDHLLTIPANTNAQFSAIFRIYEREVPVAWKEKAMGEIIWQEGHSGLAVSTYSGPARPAGASPTRVQVTTADGQFLQLNLGEWADLCSAVRHFAGEYPSPHPDGAWENDRDLRPRGNSS
jgi:hypothetical protein